MQVQRLAIMRRLFHKEWCSIPFWKCVGEELYGKQRLPEKNVWILDKIKLEVSLSKSYNNETEVIVL